MDPSFSRPIVVCIVCLIVYKQGWDTTAPGPDLLRPRNRMLSIKLTYWLSR